MNFSSLYVSLTNYLKFRFNALCEFSLSLMSSALWFYRISSRYFSLSTSAWYFESRFYISIFMCEVLKRLARDFAYWLTSCCISIPFVRDSLDRVPLILSKFDGGLGGSIIPLGGLLKLGSVLLCRTERLKFCPDNFCLKLGS